MALATVVFAIVDGVLVKPLSLPQPSELFLVRADVTNTKGAVTTDRVQAPPVSGIEIDAWREAIPEIPLTAVSTPFRFKRTDGREYWAANVDAQFFDVMGLRPLAGGFVPEDYDWDQRDRGRAIRPLLVSHRYWQQVLGGDPGVIGRTVDRWERDGITWGERIAGVLPRDFVFPVDPEEPQPELVSPMPRRPGLNVDYQVVLRLRQSADLPRVRDRLLVGLRQAAAAAAAGVAPATQSLRHRAPGAAGRTARQIREASVRPAVLRCCASPAAGLPERRRPGCGRRVDPIDARSQGRPCRSAALGIAHDGCARGVRRGGCPE